ncbi:MAG: hypothetical protein AAGA60_08350 [Cyanobacteria bacterium P01_E01_bin.42]
MKYITPLFWSLLAVIALMEFSGLRAVEEVALNSLPSLPSSSAEMPILK